MSTDVTEQKARDKEKESIIRTKWEAVVIFLFLAFSFLSMFPVTFKPFHETIRHVLCITVRLFFSGYFRSRFFLFPLLFWLCHGVA